MAEAEHYFVEWKEQFVSKERGNRVVHYFLKDNLGESTLAVVGTERSVRHMFYVVSEEFLSLHGAQNSVHAGFRWRSRREVVNWLTSMLSKQHMQGEFAMSPNGGPSFDVRAHMPSQKSHLARNLKSHNLGIKWSGMPWACGKQLKHYPAFSRNGVSIAVNSFVFVMAEKDNRYIAYLEDMYEDRKLQKKVKVRWFHHNREVKGVSSLRNLHPKEVFITPYVQVISAECIDGPAIVLTREHYEKCLAVFPNDMLGRVHFCFRLFKSNRPKPFKLTKLPGYFNQSIFSCFSPDFFEDDELSSEDDDVKVGDKRNRSCLENQKVRYELPYNKLKYGLGSRESNFLKQIESHLRHTPTFAVNENLEFLCQDSGLRGCWFRCRVLEVSKRRIKIVHDDVKDEDCCTNLEEWIPTDRVAKADKLGMRHLRRAMVRPAYPKVERSLTFEVGDPVDGWWCDGWWEGVITSDNNDGNYQIYIPGENMHINVEEKNLRVSKDWVGDHWVDVEPKPNILHVISGSCTQTKPLPSPAVSKETKVDHSSPTYSHKIITVHEPVVGDIHDLEGMTLTNVPLKDECAYNEQQRILETDEKEYYSEHVNEEDTEDRNANNDLTDATNAHNNDFDDGKAGDVDNGISKNKVEETVTVEPTCEAEMKEAEAPSEC